MSTQRSFCLVLPFLLMVVLVGCGKSGSIRESAGAGTRPVHQSKSPQLQSSKLRVVTSGVKELSWQAGGQYIMRAKARQLVADEETGKAILRDGRAILFKQGKESALMSARLIEADNRTSSLMASGGITVRSLVRNARISANSLTWQRKQNRLFGTGGVNVTSSVGYISADRMDGDTSLRQITLYSDRGGRASLNVSIGARRL